MTPERRRNLILLGLFGFGCYQLGKRAGVRSVDPVALMGEIVKTLPNPEIPKVYVPKSMYHLLTPSEGLIFKHEELGDMILHLN